MKQATIKKDGDMTSRLAFVATFVIAVAFALPASADTTIKSADGVVQITVPNGWREVKPLGPNIQVQAASGRGGLVLVRVVSKDDFKDLKSFANFGLERLKKNTPDADPKM